MNKKCPDCGGELECLGGCSAHHSNWYCKKEISCGWQAWHIPDPVLSPDEIANARLHSEIKQLKKHNEELQQVIIEVLSVVRDV